jgi:hypothetical protein
VCSVYSVGQLSFMDFIQSLQKTETHLHIEGALPYSLLNDTKVGSIRFNH